MITAFAALAVVGANVASGPTDDTRAVITQALHDAQSRSSLLLQPTNAGHDGGFFIADESGDFLLKISGQIQTRWLAAWRDGDGGVDSFISGFQMRRVKLSFEGHIFDESLRFKITNEFSRSSGASGVSDALIEKRFENGVSILGGQFTLPFTREDLDSSKRQLAVDRTLVNSVFRLNRSQGVQIGFRDDDWRAWFAYSDGARSKNIDFGADPTDWAVTGRLEWLALGSFGVFRTQSGAIDAEPSLRIGSAIHAEERGDTPGDAGGRLVSWTGDIAAAGPGWMALTTVVGRENRDPAGMDFTDWGVTAQLGVWVTDSIVPFTRWELLIPDRDRDGGSKTNILSAGATWYIHGDALKFTIDGVWLIDGASSNDLIDASTGTGVLDPGFGGSEFVLRAQVQLLF